MKVGDVVHVRGTINKIMEQGEGYPTLARIHGSWVPFTEIVHVAGGMEDEMGYAYGDNPVTEDAELYILRTENVALRSQLAEAKGAELKTLGWVREERVRAERAEAIVTELRTALRTAIKTRDEFWKERDALRESLESLIYDAELQMKNPSHHMPFSLPKARATLATSPAAAYPALGDPLDARENPEAAQALTDSINDVLAEDEAIARAALATSPSGLP